MASSSVAVSVSTLEKESTMAVQHLLDRLNTEHQWIVAHSLNNTDQTSILRSYQTMANDIIQFVWTTVAALRSTQPRHCNARLAQLITHLMNLKLTSETFQCSFLRKDICRYLDKSNPEQMIRYRHIRNLLSGVLTQLVFDPNDQSQYGGFKFVIRDNSTNQLYVNSAMAPIWLERYNEYKHSIHTLNGVSGWKDIGVCVGGGNDTYIRLYDFLPLSLRRVELDPVAIIAWSLSCILPEYLMVFPTATHSFDIRFRTQTTTSTSSSSIRYYVMDENENEDQTSNADLSDSDTSVCINPNASVTRAASVVAADCKDVISAEMDSTVSGTSSAFSSSSLATEASVNSLEPLFALIDEERDRDSCLLDFDITSFGELGR